MDEVLNQVPPLEDCDLYETDVALRAAAGFFGGESAQRDLQEIGRAAGSAASIRLGFEANAYVPELHTHDRTGRRIDEVWFHPSWHALLQRAASFGLHGAAWHDPRAGAHVARAAGFYLWNQAEAGHGCPISMTYAAVPALRHAPKLAALLEPKLAAREYDPVLAPLATKTSALCGMGMTEKQGGSDVRANTTRAEFLEEDALGARYALTGHKWFCSAPMSDVFLILAQAPAGLSCFLLPRVLADGTRNPFAIQRLKDKLGNRSNASSEVEFSATSAWLVGEEGRGVRTIIEMVNGTRLDCVNGSAALMRQAFVQAAHHARNRKAFGALLIHQPAMQNVLADLALESEAAMLLLMRLARAADRGGGDAAEMHVKRAGTAMAKYWICKRTPAVVAEALECLGGNGYVEESVLPRLYREAPLNSIWEGSGNVNALDVLRALSKTPDAYAAYRAEVAGVADDPAVAPMLQDAERTIGGDDAQAAARLCAERLAIVWQYALLRAHAPQESADAFYRSRIKGERGASLGTLPADVPFAAIVDRAFLV